MPIHERIRATVTVSDKNAIAPVSTAEKEAISCAGELSAGHLWTTVQAVIA